MTTYQTYQEVLEKGQKNAEMNYRVRQRLIKDIDRLDTKDHIGILKIIMESIDRKIYTVNNYGTYFDLNDLDNGTLWKISYHVSLCLENMQREEYRKEAEKQYKEDLTTLEDQLKTNAKIKITTNRLKLDVSRPASRNCTTSTNSCDGEEEDDDEDDDLGVENKLLDDVDDIEEDGNTTATGIILDDDEETVPLDEEEDDEDD